MSVVDRLLTERFAEPSTRNAFEGPFGDDKKRSMTDEEAGRHIAAVAALISRRFPNGGGRIGVLSNHRVETYVAVLGTVAAGATFVPLNPKFPVERLRSIVVLGGVGLILGDRSTQAVAATVAPAIEFIDVAAVVPAVGWAAAPTAESADTSSIAYVMFTSGSTGTPKGVPITYGNLLAYVDAVEDLLEIPRDARFTQLFDLSFDLSMHDIFVSTRMRGTLIAPTQIDLMMPGAYVAREAIDAWFSVPILGAQLGGSARKDGFAGLRSMLFCGEALPMETVAACRGWLAPGARMWNLYGPTEATIAFTAADVTDSRRSEGNASIGHPFGANVTAMLDASGAVVTTTAVGDEGELLLAGPQVFGGYSTDAPSPFVVHDGVTYYRSGDLVRIDDEGVYFRGRVDSQVKFRGYRIELGEIETAARAAFGLKTLAVVVGGTGAAAKLVLFHLSGEAGERTIDPKLLEETLPKYMVPAEFVALEAMPTNANGKIDRRVLTAMADGSGG